MIKYSLIIPVYNCAGTILNTVQSVMHSGLSDFEIILVDDGSTDQSPALCDQLSRDYETIRCIHQQNNGVSAARNQGIRASQGKYLIFVDADDTLVPDSMLRVQEIIFDQAPDLVIYGMQMNRYYHGKLLHTEQQVWAQEETMYSPQWNDHLDALFCCNYLSSACNKVFRRDLLQKNGIFFRETMKLMEDCQLSLEYLSRCSKVCLLPGIVYRYAVDEEDNRALRRIQQIPSLSTYMEHFSGLPAEYDQLINDIYYMLLRIEVGSATLSQLKTIAADHAHWSMLPRTVSQTSLNRELQQRRLRLRLRMLKSSVRHRVALYLKSKGLY